MRATRLALSIAIAGGLLSTASPAEEIELQSDEQKILYAIGVALAKGLNQFDLQDEEIPYVIAGLKDHLAGGEYRIELEPYNAQIQAFAKSRRAGLAEEEQAHAQAFLEEAAAEPGAVQTESGLVYRELEPGEGASPSATDVVRVHYHGTLRDGTVFDSSVERGVPARFALNRVIPCWTEALQRMKVGSKAVITCPAKIAYGNAGAGEKIKPGAALRFEVELLGIETP